MDFLKENYTNDILSQSMNGKRKFRITRADGSAEEVTIEDVSEYDQIGSLFGAGDINKTNQVVNRCLRTSQNNNLLINPNFANPINQRNITSKEDEGYWIDRWKKREKEYVPVASVKNGYIEFTGGNTATPDQNRIYQLLEERLEGKTITFSVKLYNGKIVETTAKVPDKITATSQETILSKTIYENCTISIVIQSYTGTLFVSIAAANNSTLRLEWAKLEIGEHASNFTPRTYAEELLLCKRYARKINVKSAKLVRLDSDYIRFAYTFETEMRVAPTANSSNVKVLKNNVETSELGFVVNVPTSGVNGIEITCVNYINGIRAEHKLGYEDIISISGEVFLDSEI